MADKAVGELIEAQQITPNDLFVLEQNGTAKKLTGQTLENWLVSFADGHGGIQKIEKTGTTGLTDTYTITLADTTTFSFTVTNGKSIVSITKTGTVGLVDTYTISYNDGTTTQFLVANGRGITKVEQTGVNGLARTYTITYNDGTSYAFTVTDGAKGDTGDNAYIWIKFASQNPANPPHSIGDLPDAWMGVYTGISATAPTNWDAYRWYEIEGAKGDTGEPATLTSGVTEYQVSDNGSIYPSGSWSTNPPVVPQGKYLWTRTTLTFNSGNPVVSYSVTRMGIDGAGSVSSVCNVSPDENGNVALTAENVGALPTTGGAMTGPLNMQGQILEGLNPPTEDDQPATKGYVDSQTIQTDQTLTVEGAAADAKAVGDRLGTESTASGTLIEIESEDKPVITGVKVFGMSTQDGTPSPENPANITNAGEDGNLDLVVTGKNFFDGVIESGNIQSGVNISDTNVARSSNYVSVIPGETYTFSIDGVKNKLIIHYYDNAKNWINNYGANGYACESGTFVAPDNAYYLKFRSYASDLSAMQTGKLQLELGSTATPYEPFGGSATLTTALPLCAIPVSEGGNYTDPATGQQYIADVLTVNADGSGSVEKRCHIIDSYSGQSITGVYISTTGSLTTGAKIIYASSTPTTHTLTPSEVQSVLKLQGFTPKTTITAEGAPVEVYYATGAVGKAYEAAKNTAATMLGYITGLQAQMI